MNERCPFPDCILDVEHDGDHEFDPTKPYGALRCVQQFNLRCFGPLTPHCDIHSDRYAHALYMDQRRKGWALCQECEGEYVTAASPDLIAEAR